MVRIRTVYTCQGCGYKSPRWLGRCPDCGQWNTLVEERVVEPGRERRGARPAQDPRVAPLPIGAIQSQAEARVRTGIGELDRVLGGGIVPGSLVLIGGDPGIGKSTLLLQAMEQLARDGRTVLYVSGEESPQQIKLRGERLGVGAPTLYVLAETCLERLLEEVERLSPAVLVIDSIQTIYTAEVESAPGSVSQVRETCGKLMTVAKGRGISTFLIGHVTKEGAIAGPRVLEHMVDTVLYFEGDRGHPYRILRAVKNRFGSTNELGVFAMKEVGLEEVTNPSELFLSERPLGVSGSVVVPSLEGTRPILVELQALVSGSSLALPRRTTMGVDHNRVGLLVAVLEKKVGLHLLNQDIFVNVAGGIKLVEPAVDLGIVVAVASSFLERPVDARTVVMGEVGLAGEIRAVAQVEVRIREAEKLGFTRALLPERNLGRLTLTSAIDLVGVSAVKDALEVLF
ncbi:MAG: DNA repair protein RadA [Deltaproteobacteria bacterium]|nr:DNA repair protein RadA [Deltaproteobacteria bacterium]